MCLPALLDAVHDGGEVVVHDDHVRGRLSIIQSFISDALIRYPRPYQAKDPLTTTWT